MAEKIELVAIKTTKENRWGMPMVSSVGTIHFNDKGIAAVTKDIADALVAKDKTISILEGNDEFLQEAVKQAEEKSFQQMSEDLNEKLINTQKEVAIWKARAEAAELDANNQRARVSELNKKLLAYAKGEIKPTPEKTETQILEGTSGNLEIEKRKAELREKARVQQKEKFNALGIEDLQKVAETYFPDQKEEWDKLPKPLLIDWLLTKDQQPRETPKVDEKILITKEEDLTNDKFTRDPKLAEELDKHDIEALKAMVRTAYEQMTPPQEAPESELELMGTKEEVIDYIIDHNLVKSGEAVNID